VRVGLIHRWRADTRVMELSPFRIERFYAQYEHSTRYMLSSSDCQSRTTAAATKATDHHVELPGWG